MKCPHCKCEIKSKPPSRIQQLEVEWYRRHGKYRERICRDSMGREYVVGDWSWNRLHPEHQEHIEHRMSLMPQHLNEL